MQSVAAVHAWYSLWEVDREGLQGEWEWGGGVACAGGGAGLALGTGVGTASPSGAGAGAGTLRTLLTRSVSRDTGLGGWVNGGVEEDEQMRNSERGKKKRTKE